MAKDKRKKYFYIVNKVFAAERCHFIKDNLIGSIACANCEHCEGRGSENGKGYIICKVITKATGKE